MLDSLNRSVVFAGALMTLIIAVPAALVSGLLSDGGGTDQSNWVFLALLAIIIAYLLGGALAGRGAAIGHRSSTARPPRSSPSP